MKEVKNPQRPMAFYYGIALLVILLFNSMAKPYMEEAKIEQVDYGTFMSMTEEKKVTKADIQDNQILFTDTDNKLFKTGIVNDEGLVDRLHKAGVTFSSDIKAKESPLMNFLLTWVLPIAIFFLIGQYMSKKLMERAGGGNSMMFGLGKSQARVYVPSSEGILFKDVAGEDEAKENLSEIVDYLHDPNKYSSIGASMPKGVLLVGPPGTGKTMLGSSCGPSGNR